MGGQKLQFTVGGYEQFRVVLYNLDSETWRLYLKKKGSGGILAQWKYIDKEGLLSSRRGLTFLISFLRGRPEISTFSTYGITSHNREGGGSKKCRQSHNFFVAYSLLRKMHKLA